MTILTDNIDVYVLRCYHYFLQIPMIMASSIKERKVLIHKLLWRSIMIIPSLIAGHALSGCDTVAACNGLSNVIFLSAFSFFL